MKQLQVIHRVIFIFVLCWHGEFIKVWLNGMEDFNHKNPVIILDFDRDKIVPHRSDIPHLFCFSIFVYPCQQLSGQSGQLWYTIAFCIICKAHYIGICRCFTVIVLPITILPAPLYKYRTFVRRTYTPITSTHTLNPNPTQNH